MPALTASCPPIPAAAAARSAAVLPAAPSFISAPVTSESHTASPSSTAPARTRSDTTALGAMP